MTLALRKGTIQNGSVLYFKEVINRRMSSSGSCKVRWGYKGGVWDAMETSGCCGCHEKVITLRIELPGCSGFTRLCREVLLQVTYSLTKEPGFQGDSVAMWSCLASLGAVTKHFGISIWGTTLSEKLGICQGNVRQGVKTAKIEDLHLMGDWPSPLELSLLIRMGNRN